MSSQTVRSAARALIQSEGKILVVCHLIEGQTHYLLPGGGQDHGESLVETVRRECREELGCEVEVGRLFCVREFIEHNHPGSFPSDFGDLHAVEHVFECRLSGGEEIDPNSRGDRTQAGLEWFSAEELRGLPFHPLDLLELLEGDPAGPRYLGDTN